ncbi:N-lysine methyltransferase SETD6 isoform X2 [Balaenoptera musculus]|uniref:N-lysine methyltransferase SETD6 n=1 Tax=Balaenoptera musculus TaxID=9771 RepID=A0A8B8VUU6_BALMU|nr:N-lysine methyltransferase SETD6 isoform X2 [Balaenoptera musculus]
MCYAEDEKLSGSILSVVLGALTTPLRNTCTNCSNCAPSQPPARPSLLIQKRDFALQPDFYPEGFQLSQTKTGKGCAWLRPGSRRQGNTSSCTRRNVFYTQVGRPGLKDVLSRGRTTRCKPPLIFRVEVETNVTWSRGGNIGPASESPAPGRRKRLRGAAESRGCAPLDHGDPDEAPAGGRACGQRGPGPGGRLPELVPAGGTGAESQERGALQSQSGWVPLLLALLHELQAPASPWSPYFALWPELGRLEHPMFWPEEERRRLLQGTGVPEAVEKDLASIRSEYYSIVLPFMEAHPDLFSPRVRCLELYRQLVALVMAYSFQEPLEEEEDEKEPNSPLMVPAADVLNHLANHNANLEYSPNCLRMVATQPIPKGHEIFNTYGQMANWQLIHMYGFAEPYPDNTDDTADIQMVTVREAALQGTEVEAERLLLYERWDFLCKLEMVGEEGAFVIGWEEVLTEEELAMTLKVLCMPAEEFREFKDQDGRGDDRREEDSLTITNIPKLKASWRQLLRDSVLLTLQTYATDLKAEQDLLSNKEVYATLSWREQQALQVRYGQKMILHQLLELTN